MAAKKKSSKTKASRTKASDTESVEAYVKNLKHPLVDLVKAVRKTILAVDSKIGEEIKWNAASGKKALVNAVKIQLKRIHD